MYSGACFGGARLWYFGGAHRSYPGNDVDLFDPRANAWRQVTEPEMPTRGSELWNRLTGGGGGARYVTSKGRPYVEHTYQQVCWDPVRKHFFVVMLASGTWAFDPRKAEWTFLSGTTERVGAEPRGHWSHNQVVWDPGVKAPVLLVSSGGGGIWKWDYDRAEWERLAALPRELNWTEFYLTHVPAWERYLLSASKVGWGRLDVATGTLEKVEAPRELERCQALSFDAANQVVIALQRKALGKRVTTVVPWALHVETGKWTKLDPPEPWPKGSSTGRWASFWYDPEHNVHYLVNDVRRDRQELFDGGVTETWAYRYTKSAGGR